MTEVTAPVETPVVSTETPAETPTYNVPEAYAEKSWATNIKSEDDLYKQFDGLQGMVGKKNIPTSESSEEDWTAFHNQIRPETHDAYELSLPEGMEGIEVNEEEQGAYKQIFHDLGLSQKQADELYKAHAGIESAKQSTYDADFDKLLSEKFGDKGEAALKTTLDHALEHSPETKEMLASLPPKQMMAMVELVNAMNEKMPAKTEDGAPVGGEGSTPTTMTEKIQESNRIRRSLAVRDPFHPDFATESAKLKKLDEMIASAT